MWALILLTWEAAFRLVEWNVSLFPAPSHVANGLAELFKVRPLTGSRPLIEGPIVSLVRLSIGFAAALAIGGVIGLLMWRFLEFDKMVGPLLLGFQTLPSVCWVPLAIATLREDETRILFVVVMGSFSAIAIALRDGLRMIPPVFQKAGLMLGADGWRLYRYVLLPASLPAMATSLRQGFAFAWRSLIGAEMLFVVMTNQGLGLVLNVAQGARIKASAAQVVAVMMVMILIGMSADRLIFAPLQRRVRERFGLG